MALNAEAIAHVCHEANRALQLEQNDPTIPVSAAWVDLDEETRQSAIEGVENILSGVVRSPEESHESWCDFKREHGWIYGEVKDEEAKTHPCLVPYDQLPLSFQIKDALFWNIVGALATPQDEDPVQRSFDQGFSEARGE